VVKLFYCVARHLASPEKAFFGEKHNFLFESPRRISRRVQGARFAGGRLGCAATFILTGRPLRVIHAAPENRGKELSQKRTPNKALRAMTTLSPLINIPKQLFIGVWRVVEFIAALIYYLLTEIFVDPFIIIKPIKIAAHWFYDYCDRFPIVSLYFTYLAHPESKHWLVHWLSQRPWVVALPPALMVMMTVGIKFLALSIAASSPVLAAVIFVGDKITLVPVALRMWDDVRPVVRRDFTLRQIDNVIHFIFHQLPRRARYVVKRQTRRLKRFFGPLFAPALTVIRALVAPIRAVLSPLARRLTSILRVWGQAVRTAFAAVFWRRERGADVAPVSDGQKGQNQRDEGERVKKS
jgi:hypothetical protein